MFYLDTKQLIVSYISLRIIRKTDQPACVIYLAKVFPLCSSHAMFCTLHCYSCLLTQFVKGEVCNSQQAVSEAKSRHYATKQCQNQFQISFLQDRDLSTFRSINTIKMSNQFNEPRRPFCFGMADSGRLRGPDLGHFLMPGKKILLINIGTSQFNNYIHSF